MAGVLQSADRSEERRELNANPILGRATSGIRAGAHGVFAVLHALLKLAPEFHGRMLGAHPARGIQQCPYSPASAEHVDPSAPSYRLFQAGERFFARLLFQPAARLGLPCSFRRSLRLHKELRRPLPRPPRKLFRLRLPARPRLKARSLERRPRARSLASLLKATIIRLQATASLLRDTRRVMALLQDTASLLQDTVSLLPAITTAPIRPSGPNKSTMTKVRPSRLDTALKPWPTGV